MFDKYLQEHIVPLFNIPGYRIPAMFVWEWMMKSFYKEFESALDRNGLKSTAGFIEKK